MPFRRHHSFSLTTRLIRLLLGVCWRVVNTKRKMQVRTRARRTDNGIDGDTEPFLTEADEEGWLGYILDAVTPVFKLGVIIIALYRAAWAVVDLYAIYLWAANRDEFVKKTCSVNIAQWVGVAGVIGLVAVVWLVVIYSLRVCACTGRRCCGVCRTNENQCRTEIGLTIIISVLVYVCCIVVVVVLLCCCVGCMLCRSALCRSDQSDAH